MVEATDAALAAAREDLGFLILDKTAFEQSPKKSIDYAVMERTHRAAVVPADIGWSDVGNWDAVWKLSPHDADGNAIHGNGVTVDAKNVNIRSDDLLTAVVGVDDVTVVSTQDAVLVLRRDRGRQGQGRSSTRSSSTGGPRRPSTSASTGRGAITARSIPARATR